jgi:hypothetical protein
VIIILRRPLWLDGFDQVRSTQPARRPKHDLSRTLRIYAFMTIGTQASPVKSDNETQEILLS